MQIMASCIFVLFVQTHTSLFRRKIGPIAIHTTTQQLSHGESGTTCLFPEDSSTEIGIGHTYNGAQRTDNDPGNAGYAGSSLSPDGVIGV